MDEYQLIGYVVSTLITLSGFVTVIIKFTQPINDLRLAIQKLSDSIDSMRTNAERQDRLIDEHETKINEIDGRMTKLETKVNIYHNGKGGE